MYHIAQDKRAKKSAALICEGMLVCLKEKPLSQITVTDIGNASGVSRATFYRLFDNVMDVLTYQCEQVISSIVGSFLSAPPVERTYRQMTITILSTAMEHWQLLSAVSSNQRLDIVYNALCKEIPTLRQIYGIEKAHDARLDESFLHCVCSLIATMIDLWIRQGQTQDADSLYSDFAQVIHMLEDAFGGSE